VQNLQEPATEGNIKMV